MWQVTLRRDPVVSGMMRLHVARSIADDLSAEGFGPLRWVLWNPDLAGTARQCRAEFGAASFGRAGNGKDCRRQYGGLRPSLLFSREQVGSGSTE